MVRYKVIYTSPRFLAVDLERQLLLATATLILGRFAIKPWIEKHEVQHVVDLHAFRFWRLSGTSR